MLHYSYCNLNNCNLKTGDERAMTSTSFFVHYDPTFANVIDSKNNVSKERKMTKIFSRKQYEEGKKFFLFIQGKCCIAKRFNLVKI